VQLLDKFQTVCYVLVDLVLQKRRMSVVQRSSGQNQYRVRTRDERLYFVLGHGFLLVVNGVCQEEHRTNNGERTGTDDIACEETFD
jgi:hypothetical protein